MKYDENTEMLFSSNVEMNVSPILPELQYLIIYSILATHFPILHHSFMTRGEKNKTSAQICKQKKIHTACTKKAFDMLMFIKTNLNSRTCISGRSC